MEETSPVKVSSSSDVPQKPNEIRITTQGKIENFVAYGMNRLKVFFFSSS